MMNDFLRFNSSRNVTAFIDNVMVVIQREKGHDEIVEKILKKMMENYLFLKPENYI